MNCPEYSERSGSIPGSGILYPSSKAASIHAFLASFILAIASSMVSPTLMHPGRSGMDTPKPPVNAIEKVYQALSKLFTTCAIEKVYHLSK